jgi:hypothetical protein
MSALAHLRSLAQGRRPADDGLLGNTRCAWGGAEVLSEEPILAAFAARSFDAAGELAAVETPQSAAIVWADRALVADVYEGRIGRLWRVGDEPAVPPEPAIDVAFDPDMRQERGSVFFRREDHPALDDVAVEPLLATAEDLIEATQAKGKLRVRGFVVRAFGGHDGSVALVSLYSMGNETSRTSSFTYAVVSTGPAGANALSDRPPGREWTPRL